MNQDYKYQKKREFLNWLEKNKEYQKISGLELDDYMKLVSFIVDWCRLSFIENEEREEPEKPIFSSLPEAISQKFPSAYRERLIDCEYGTAPGLSEGAIIVYPVDDDGGLSFYLLQIFLEYLQPKKDGLYRLPLNYFYSPKNGKICDPSKPYGSSKKIEGIENIEDLLTEVEQNYSDELDCSELKRIIEFHNFEIELRNRLFQLVSLGMLFSYEEVEYGYRLAKKFIIEMNQEFGISLSTTEIDRLYEKYKERKINPKTHQKAKIKKTVTN